MNGNAMVATLAKVSPVEKVDILENLHCALLLNGGRIPFYNTEQAMKDFAILLSVESNSETIIACLQLIGDLIPLLGSQLDVCMTAALPSIITCLGDTNNHGTIRDAAIEVLQQYVRHSDTLSAITRAIIDYGLNSKHRYVHLATIKNIPNILVAEHANFVTSDSDNFCELVQTLMYELNDLETRAFALRSLQRLSSAIELDTFTSYITDVPIDLRRIYETFITSYNSRTVDMVPSRDNRFDISLWGRRDSDTILMELFASAAGARSTITNFADSSAPSRPAKSSLEFGMFPRQIIDDVENQTDSRVRAQTLEEMRVTISDCKSLQSMLTPLSHLANFINFIGRLLDDRDFKVSTATLDILFIIVDRLGGHVMISHVKAIITALIKHMDDSSRTIRIAIMRIMLSLMRSVSPRIVLVIICENMSQRNAAVRQELLNIIISAVIIFSPSEVDLSKLCHVVSCSLVDSRRPVRQAAMECVAVLASKLDAAHHLELMQIIASIERSSHVAGVVAAVSSRLAPHRQVPRRDADGLVEYTPLDMDTADVAWVLSAAPGYGSSAQYSGSIVSSVSSSPSVWLPSDVNHLVSVTNNTTSGHSFPKSHKRSPSNINVTTVSNYAVSPLLLPGPRPSVSDNNNKIKDDQLLDELWLNADLAKTSDTERRAKQCSRKVSNGCAPNEGNKNCATDDLAVNKSGSDEVLSRKQFSESCLNVIDDTDVRNDFSMESRHSSSSCVRLEHITAESSCSDISSAELDRQCFDISSQTLIQFNEFFEHDSALFHTPNNYSNNYSIDSQPTETSQYSSIAKRFSSARTTHLNGAEEEEVNSIVSNAARNRNRNQIPAIPLDKVPGNGSDTLILQKHSSSGNISREMDLCSERSIDEVSGTIGRTCKSASKKRLDRIFRKMEKKEHIQIESFISGASQIKPMYRNGKSIPDTDNKTNSPFLVKAQLVKRSSMRRGDVSQNAGKYESSARDLGIDQLKGFLTLEQLEDTGRTHLAIASNGEVHQPKVSHKNIVKVPSKARDRCKSPNAAEVPVNIQISHTTDAPSLLPSTIIEAYSTSDDRPIKPMPVSQSSTGTAVLNSIEGSSCSATFEKQREQTYEPSIEGDRLQTSVRENNDI